MSSRICVGVLFGGESGEHYVSIKSAITLIGALQRGTNATRFKVLPIYIDQKGVWCSLEVAEKVLKKGKPINLLEEGAISIASEGFRGLPQGSEEVDVWFPVLHGPNGEDGTVQGLFKLMGKPFVGSGVLGSAVGMDKLAMKSAFASAGLPQVAYEFVQAFELEDTELLDVVVERLEAKLSYPCFIKPANLGSSVGISKAFNRNEMLAGLKMAASFDERIVVEKALVVRELECAVLGKKSLKASLVGEVIFESDWYDYNTKYGNGGSQVIIPAALSEDLTAKVRRLSLSACRAVGAVGMARVDFFYEESVDNLWLNEINTIPGFTNKSMYPMLWEVSGLNLEALVANLVDTARE